MTSRLRSKRSRFLRLISSNILGISAVEVTPLFKLFDQRVLPARGRRRDRAKKKEGRRGNGTKNEFQNGVDGGEKRGRDEPERELGFNDLQRRRLWFLCPNRTIGAQIRMGWFSRSFLGIPGQ